MKSHEIDYTIHGDDMQVVSVELDPGETVIAEAGSMNWMESGINSMPRWATDHSLIMSQDQICSMAIYSPLMSRLH